jgi:hypothetical protein
MEDSSKHRQSSSSSSSKKRPHGKDSHGAGNGSSSSGGSGGSGGEFVCFRQFSNSLPNAPSGPFFKPRTLNTQESFEKYAKYEVSSLEKSFIWQPHFGQDLGINLDLVDQESMLVYIPNQATDPRDAKFLQAMGAGDSIYRKKSRGQGELFNEKPWWLRNTTYSENNLFKVNTRELPSAQMSKTIRAVADPFSPAVIDSSFTDVDKTLRKQIEQTKDKTVEWCVDILPSDVIASATLCPFSIVRFDEDPRKLIDNSNITTGHKRMKKSIIANARTFDMDGQKQAVQVSLVASVDPDVELESFVETNTTDSMYYEWVSDFRMDVRSGEVDDFLVVVTNSGSSDSSNSSRNAGDQPKAVAAEYYQVLSRMEMRKLAKLECAPHDGYVFRRPTEN